MLREVYTQHKCVNKKHLGKLDRNLSSLASKVSGATPPAGLAPGCSSVRLVRPAQPARSLAQQVCAEAP